MRTRAALLLTTGLVAIAVPAVAQTASQKSAMSGAARGIYRPNVASTVQTNATFSVTSGTLVVKLALAVLSPVPTSVPIFCSANATVGIAFEAKTVVATRTSPGAASCTVAVPYELNIYPGRATFSATYAVFYGEGSTLGGSGSSASGEVDSEFLSEALPASGTTTTYSGSVKL